MYNIHKKSIKHMYKFFYIIYKFLFYNIYITLTFASLFKTYVCIFTMLWTVLIRSTASGKNRPASLKLFHELAKLVLRRHRRYVGAPVWACGTPSGRNVRMQRTRMVLTEEHLWSCEIMGWRLRPPGARHRLVTRARSRSRWRTRLRTSEK